MTYSQAENFFAQTVHSVSFPWDETEHLYFAYHHVIETLVPCISDSIYDIQLSGYKGTYSKCWITPLIQNNFAFEEIVQFIIIRLIFQQRMLLKKLCTSLCWKPTSYGDLRLEIPGSANAWTLVKPCEFPFYEVSFNLMWFSLAFKMSSVTDLALFFISLLSFCSMGRIFLSTWFLIILHLLED